MFNRTSMIVGMALVGLLLAGALSAVAAAQDVDKAFEALGDYDWGKERNVLQPIDDAVAASHNDAAARKGLQTRLAAVLGSDASRAAQDYACRKLSLIGDAGCVPALAGLLTDKKLSHMARYALERMPCAEAVAALRAALSKTDGLVKVGVINSLGVRRDAQSASALVALLADSDKEVAAAAAAALGAIGTADTAKALGTFQTKAPKELRLAAADAYLACAERLLAGGKRAQAMLIYKSLSKPQQPKHVRVAAMRGLLAATGKK